jgi:hypothetical protein
MKTRKGSVRAERLKQQNSPRLKIAHANFNDLITFAKVCRFACFSPELENWRRMSAPIGEALQKLWQSEGG